MLCSFRNGWNKGLQTKTWSERLTGLQHLNLPVMLLTEHRNCFPKGSRPILETVRELHITCGRDSLYEIDRQCSYYVKYFYIHILNWQNMKHLDQTLTSIIILTNNHTKHITDFHNLPCGEFSETTYMTITQEISAFFIIICKLDYGFRKWSDPCTIEMKFESCPNYLLKYKNKTDSKNS